MTKAHTSITHCLPQFKDSSWMNFSWNTVGCKQYFYDVVSYAPNLQELITNSFLGVIGEKFLRLITPSEVGNGFWENPGCLSIIRDTFKLGSIAFSIASDNSYGHTKYKYTMPHFYSGALRVSCKATFIAIPIIGHFPLYLPMAARIGNFICDPIPRMIITIERKMEDQGKQNMDYFKFSIESFQLEWVSESLSEVIPRAIIADVIGSAFATAPMVDFTGGIVRIFGPVPEKMFIEGVYTCIIRPVQEICRGASADVHNYFSHNSKENNTEEVVSLEGFIKKEEKLESFVGEEDTRINKLSEDVGHLIEIDLKTCIKKCIDKVDSMSLQSPEVKAKDSDELGVQNKESLSVKRFGYGSKEEFTLENVVPANPPITEEKNKKEVAVDDIHSSDEDQAALAGNQGDDANEL